MSNPSHSRMTGQIVYDPVLAAQAEARRQHIEGSIYEFVGSLPIGDTGAAPDAVNYTQPDAITCFYASLGSVATALQGRRTDVRSIGEKARSEGLLGAYGAETHPEFRDRQVEFTRRNLSLNIRFIEQFRDDESIHALTEGLVAGQHVVFGLPRHWIALDGIRKFGEARTSATWTGMNPYPQGRRIEDQARDHVTPGIVIGRLVKPDMPLVVVEGVQTRRMTGRITQATPRFQAVQPNPRFRPAKRFRKVD